MFVLAPENVGEFIPSRKKDGCKRDFGRLLILAGSRDMTGAAVLCARAALKSGAGLVTVATPASAQPVIAAGVIEATTYGLPENAKGTLAQSATAELDALIAERAFDLILAGPGLGRTPETAEFLRGFLKRCDLPAVLDADALNAISDAAKPESFFGRTGPTRILTPHIGEAERLLKTDSDTLKIFRDQSALRLADMAGGIGVLKDFETAVAAVQCGAVPRRAALNTSGSCELAKGGSGDVLAGMIAGLWAQSGKARGFTAETGFEAACAAVYLHSVCGALARRELTEYCVLAGELVDWLPKAIRKTLLGE